MSPCWAGMALVGCMAIKAGEILKSTARSEDKKVAVPYTEGRALSLGFQRFERRGEDFL